MIQDAFCFSNVLESALSAFQIIHHKRMFIFVLDLIGKNFLIVMGAWNTTLKSTYQKSYSTSFFKGNAKSSRVLETYVSFRKHLTGFTGFVGLSGSLALLLKNIMMDTSMTSVIYSFFARMVFNFLISIWIIVSEDVPVHHLRLSRCVRWGSELDRSCTCALSNWSS